MASNTSDISLAVFTALGTLVGYLGSEVATVALFERLLWPTRFYNGCDAWTLSLYALLFPMGGPLHKAAILVASQFIRSGLWRGRRQGDMLGTAFYHDTKSRYVLKQTEGASTVPKEARNAIWLRVLQLLPRRYSASVLTTAKTTGDVHSASDKPLGVAETSSTKLPDKPAIRQENVRHARPVLSLSLERCTVKGLSSSDEPGIVREDTDHIAARHILGLVMSEALSLSVGIVSMAIWRTWFSSWYFVPLLLKLVALFCQVRREPLASTGSQEQAQIDVAICEVIDDSSGFTLIHGPADVVLQFFRHYAHPQRSSRVRELTAMITVYACIVVYPAGLLSFIFASPEEQWTWLAYQLYSVLAMHMIFFNAGGLQHIGTTEALLAQRLSRYESATLVNSTKSGVRATLESFGVSKVAEGRAALRQLSDTLLAEQRSKIATISVTQPTTECEDREAGTTAGPGATSRSVRSDHLEIVSTAAKQDTATEGKGPSG